MKCPRCDFEPRDRLLHRPCPSCGHVWWDTESYVMELVGDFPVETVLDIGCGQKGIIAQHFWENVKRVKRGYACDRFTIKKLPPIWKPLLMDAEQLPSVLPSGVDVTTHCGLLEHVDYEKAFRVLRAIEEVTWELIFFSASAELRQVDYKVKRDGNPYHYYRSFWGARTFELLGYHVDRPRMVSGETFCEEVMGWCRPREIAEPWETREARARDWLAARRCSVPGCPAEPFVWDGRQEGDHFYCLVHYVEKYGEEAKDVRWWLDQPSIDGLFSPPPWRKERLIPRLGMQ